MKELDYKSDLSSEDGFKDSIKHCANSDFKYYIYYVTDYIYTFNNDYKYRDNAVSK